MRRALALIPLLLVILVLTPSVAFAGKKKKAGRKTGKKGGRLLLMPASDGRAAGLEPISQGRAAGLEGISHGRAAGLKPVTIDRAAGLESVSQGRAAKLPPVTRGRAAGLKPVTIDRPASLESVSFKRVAGLEDVARGRTAGGLFAATYDNLKSVTLGRSVSQQLYRPAFRDVPPLLRHSDRPVIVWQDGYLLPYQARRLVRDGWLKKSELLKLHTSDGYETYYRSLTRTFQRHGWGRTRLVVGPGSGYYGLNRLDACGPHWYHRSVYHIRRQGLTGRRVGDFYFPLAYYIRPYSHRWGAGRYNKGSWPILVPYDCAEAIPEDFERTLRKSHFPMVIGDMAFKEGKYVQAALAFRDALDRKAELIAGRFAFGDTLIALRNYEHAVKLIHAGLEAAPKWADRLDRNGVYGVKGHLEKHLEEVESFTKDYKNTHAGWFLLGYLRMTSGDAGLREKAIEAYAKALSIRAGDTYSQRYIDLLRGETREVDMKVEEAPGSKVEVAKAVEGEGE